MVARGDMKMNAMGVVQRRELNVESVGGDVDERELVVEGLGGQI